jgi:hypothetical protein
MVAHYCLSRYLLTLPTYCFVMMTGCASNQVTWCCLTVVNIIVVPCMMLCVHSTCCYSIRITSAHSSCIPLLNHYFSGCKLLFVTLPSPLTLPTYCFVMITTACTSNQVTCCLPKVNIVVE